MDDGIRVGATVLVLLASTVGRGAGQEGPPGGDADAGGSEPAPRAYVATAVRAATETRIDALDDDPVWSTAPPVRSLRQFDPEPDADPSFPTEFRVAYDDDDLFVLVRAFDASPDSIMRALTRRDARGPSDQIGVFVDSYRDRRSGYFFIVNPDGVKRDLAIFDDGQMDASWDAVWDVATRVDDEVWLAEFRIPLSQLRFADAEEHVFGFGVRRTIERYAEMSQWPVYSETTPGLVSQLGDLRGLEGLRSTDRFEAVPYVVTKNVTRLGDGGSWEHPQEITVGGDLKVGLGPNVVLNATVNPDFGQVEADPAVLNLSAFETFFSERRPFFVEGAGRYRFALNCYTVVDCNTNEGLFYSRRIGRSPALGDRYGDAATPSTTPIAAAAKLTGRTGSGLSFGILDAFTPAVDGTEGRTAEPGTNYSVLRLTQDLRDGDAGFGLIGTAANRSLDPSTTPYMHRTAYVAGADGRTRFGGGNYQVAGSFSVSRVSGSAEAIARTQTGAVHYLQQPGGAAVDSAATSLWGYAAQVKVGKYGGGLTRFETSLVRQSEGFEVNDLGYLRRADILDWSTWAALSFQEPASWYRWAQVNGNLANHWNSAGHRIETSVNLNGHAGLHNNWNVHLGGTLSRLGGAVCDRCTRGGPVLRRDPGFFPWAGVNTDNRKAIAPGLWTNLGFWDGGRSHSVSLNPYVDIRPSTTLSGTVGVRYYDAGDDSQWFGNFEEGGVVHHAFAHLDQRTVSVNVRVNLTVSPNLTFELYAEPFTTSGTYTDIREISATPEAADYEERFRPFDPVEDAATRFTFSQLRTNVVARWEYLPGSTVFLVWAHGREAFAEDRDRQAWHQDFGDLMDRHADNTFLVKVAYWFNR